jgi:hypothetical protein
MESMCLQQSISIVVEAHTMFPFWLVHAGMEFDGPSSGILAVKYGQNIYPAIIKVKDMVKNVLQYS